MNEEITAYVHGLFSGAPATPTVIQLEEEIVKNVADRYGDLLKDGKDAVGAYNAAIAGIGDIDALLSELGPEIAKEAEVLGIATQPGGSGYAYSQTRYSENSGNSGNAENPENAENLRYERTKLNSALMMSAAAALVFAGWIPLFAVGGTVGIVASLLLWGIGIGLAVGGAIISKPKPNRNTGTIVGEFSSWYSNRRYTALNDKAFKAISGALWCAATTLYFLISFYTMKWWITWIIFLITATIQNAFKALYEMIKEKK